MATLPAELACRNAEPWQKRELALPVYRRFTDIALSYPERVALIDHTGEYTYQQLLNRVLSLVQVIPAADKTSPIALLLPAGFDMVAGMLAVLWLGRPYVPLDVTFSAVRNKALLQHAGCQVVLTQQVYRDLLDWPFSDHVLFVDTPLNAQPKPVDYATQATDLAYILYTSGSTGQPKGVYQDQRGLLHDVMQYSQAIAIAHTDCLTGLYSPCVAGAIRDIFGAILNGATLVVMQAQQLGLLGIAKQVAKHQITIFHAIPPLLRAFLNSMPEPTLLRSVRLSYVAGDRFFAIDFKQYYQAFPKESLIYNGIGAT